MATRMNLCLRSVGICLCAALLGSSAQGLDPHKSATQFAHTVWTARDGITGPVRAIAQTPDGYLWLGTDAGLYRFDGIRFVLWQPGFGERLPGPSALSLCAARDGSLWIGFASGGISRLSHGRLKNYSPAEGAPSGGILSIVEDRNGAMWAGGTYGFGKFENGKWSQVGEDLGYPAPGLQTLLVDHRGNLWVVTDGHNFGLSKDSVRRNTILTLAPNANRFASTGEAVGQVLSMAEAPDGNVWSVDTSGTAVWPIQSGSRQKRQIVVGAESTCLLFDGDNSLWIGLGGGGLRRVADFRRKRHVALEQFQTNDGLPAAPYIQLSRTAKAIYGSGQLLGWTVSARTKSHLFPREKGWFQMNTSHWLRRGTAFGLSAIRGTRSYRSATGIFSLPGCLAIRHPTRPASLVSFPMANRFGWEAVSNSRKRLTGNSPLYPTPRPWAISRR